MSNPDDVKKNWDNLWNEYSAMLEKWNQMFPKKFLRLIITTEAWYEQGEHSENNNNTKYKTRVGFHNDLTNTSRISDSPN